MLFFDNMVYIEDNKIQATFYCKPTDYQIYHHVKSEHLKPLNNSIPCSQALRVKTLSSTPKKYERHFTTMTNKFKDSKATQKHYCRNK